MDLAIPLSQPRRRGRRAADLLRRWTPWCYRIGSRSWRTSSARPSW